MEGLLLSPGAGWVTSAPKIITQFLENKRGLKRKGDFAHTSTTCLKTNLSLGSTMEFMPPSLVLILRQMLAIVAGLHLLAFRDLIHCVTTPTTLSPTRFTSPVV